MIDRNLIQKTLEIFKNRSCKYIKSNRLAKMLDCDRRTAGRVLKKLAERGIVEQYSVSRVYVISEKYLK